MLGLICTNTIYEQHFNNKVIHNRYKLIENLTKTHLQQYWFDDGGKSNRGGLSFLKVLPIQKSTPEKWNKIINT